MEPELIGALVHGRDAGGAGTQQRALRHGFALGNGKVLMALSSLFSEAELTFESERMHEGALRLFRRRSADFADCPYAALATRASEQPRWTFNKAAARVSRHLTVRHWRGTTASPFAHFRALAS